MIGEVLSQNKKFLGFLFVFSLFLNFIFFKVFLIKDLNYFRGDTPAYVSVAKQLHQGKGFLDDSNKESYFRVPGYSIFLASCFYLFGFDLEKSVGIQIFLAAIIPILVFLLSLTFFPKSLLLAQMSSFLMAINFGTILYAGFLMSEIFFMFFFLIFSILFFSSFDLFFCKIQNRFFSFKKIFFAGLFLGFSSLIRPVGHFIIIVSILLIFLSNLFFTQKFKSAILIFSAWLLVVCFWLLRNFALTGEIFFHSMPGLHFLFLLGPDVYSKANGCSFVDARTTLTNEWKLLVLKEENKIGKKLNDIQECMLAEKVAFKYFRKYSIQTIQMSFVNFFKTLFGFHSSVLIARYSLSFPNYDTNISYWTKIKGYLFPCVKNKIWLFFVYYEVLFLILVYLGFCGVCFFACFNNYLLCELLKILPLCFLFVFLTLGIGLARLRFPIEPFLIIFSSCFWINLFKRECK